MRTRGVTATLTCLFLLYACAAVEPALSIDQSLISIAKRNNLNAQFELAYQYDEHQELDRAEHWYLRAANAGHLDAQHRVAMLYQKQQRYPEAAQWYEKASQQGHAPAANQVAYFYERGIGVAQDLDKSYQLYLQSAQLGWPEAMLNLAYIHGAGQLGEVNYQQAYIWCFLSHQHSAEFLTVQQQSAQCLSYLRKKLSPEQIRQARVEAKKIL